MQMNRLRRLFGLVALCFALVASSVTTAVARGDAAALSHGGVTLVLCSGVGYRTVALDARGVPLGPLHACPDCLAGLAAYIAPGHFAPMHPVRAVSAAPRIAPLPFADPVRYAPQTARGPPLAV